MKTLQQHLTQCAFENENITYQSDEDLVTYIRDTKKAVKAWLEEQKKEFQKQEPQPTGEWFTTYGAKLRVYTDLIESVERNEAESK